MKAQTKSTPTAAGIPAAVAMGSNEPQNQEQAWHHLREFVAARKPYLSLSAIGQLCEPKLSRAQSLALLTKHNHSAGMRVAATAARLAQLQEALKFICCYSPPESFTK